MGRPSLLNPERSAAILDLLRSGVFIQTACQAAGIGTTTYFRWLKSADNPDADPRYREFRDATTRARAQAEANAIQIVLGHGTRDWRAAAWFLERSFPERYGNRHKLEHAGKDGGPATIAGLHALMLPDDDADTGNGFSDVATPCSRTSGHVTDS